jgi:hypothetical protein
MKRGDRVVCIDATGTAEGKLVEGQEYVVMATTIDEDMMTVEDQHVGPWPASIFEVVE